MIFGGQGARGQWVWTHSRGCKGFYALSPGFCPSHKGFYALDLDCSVTGQLSTLWHSLVFHGPQGVLDPGLRTCSKTLLRYVRQASLASALLPTYIHTYIQTIMKENQLSLNFYQKTHDFGCHSVVKDVSEFYTQMLVLTALQLQLLRSSFLAAFWPPSPWG